MKKRIERDTLGAVEVDATKFWGAQTQRSLENFPIGTETTPEELIQAFVMLKRSAAIANHQLNNLSEEKKDAIIFACDRVLSEDLAEHFPLVVWQTGSGTQTNMNVNEVLAYIGNEFLTDNKQTVQLHPNDDLNHSQSSNDTFPTAMHVAAVLAIENNLLPALREMDDTLKEKAETYQDLVKIGRTHLQDATPITFGQEISGWQQMIETTQAMIKEDLVYLRQLAIGGTAVGTGLNADEDFGELVRSELDDTLKEKAETYQDLVKIGRTHLQDATPITFGQEISGWQQMIETTQAMIKEDLVYLRQLAIGGTAVGTGLNADEDFGELVADALSELTSRDFSSIPNKFYALTSHDQLVRAHGSLKALAADLMKIANDIRWLASGPRAGIGEIDIPTNEPGSSIMPGKVNPTQAEALTMVTVQVMANDTAVGFGASQGNFELNVYKPVIIYNFLQSVRLLADGIRSFNDRCLVGMKPNEEVIAEDLESSLMLVTALNPHIGYDNAAKIAKKAYLEDKTLKQASVELGLLSENEFDRLVDPEKMIGPDLEED